MAAGLGGQALERARLYERERESRAGLDRILRVAPSFLADNVESATAAICAEAAATFGADTAILWRRREQRLELACTAPPDILAAGLEASLDDFPTLRDAVENGRVSFVADVQDEARGEGLERVRALGLRSSFRVPIAIGTARRSSSSSSRGRRRSRSRIPRRSCFYAASRIKRALPSSRSSAGALRARRPARGRDSKVAGGHRGAISRLDFDRGHRRVSHACSRSDRCGGGVRRPLASRGSDRRLRVELRILGRRA